MRSRTAWRLAALALVVLAATLGLGDGDRGLTRLPPAGIMFPGLAASLAGARRVEITHAGTQLVVARDGDDWTLPDRGGYSIDPATLHSLLAGLVALRLVEPRTAQPQYFGRLGVDDPAMPQAAGTLLRVLAGDGTPLAAVVLGHDALNPQGEGAREDLYVRRPAERQTWLAAPLVSASADWHDWVSPQIVDIRPDDVVHIVSRRGDAPPIELIRQNGQLALAAPADHPPLDQFKVEDMSRALASLDLLDVRPTASALANPVGEVTVTTSQGLAVTAAVARAGDGLWVSLRAQGDGAAADTADRLQARLAGWSFRIAPWKEAALVPAMSDLAAYAPDPPAAAAADPAKPARR